MMIYDNDFVGWMGIYNIFNRALKGILNLRKKNYFKVKDVKTKMFMSFDEDS